MAIACPIDLDTGKLHDDIQSTVSLRERFDAFHGTSKERVAAKYGVMGVNVFALKKG